jgi:hypothetical protein
VAPPEGPGSAALDVVWWTERPGSRGWFASRLMHVSCNQRGRSLLTVRQEGGALVEGRILIAQRPPHAKEHSLRRQSRPEPLKAL